ncbi:MAG: hypothetical protein F9B45_31815, partial [Phycisphaera sp. RhM]|nr:hypothetical protein [Phycisphaera sp. RhM]
TGDGDASSPYPGFWESIYIDAVGSVLSNVVVRYAGDTDGNGAFTGDRQAIEVSTDMTLTNVDVESSYGGGLRIEGGANVTYTGGRLDSTTESVAARSAISVVDGTLIATDLDLIANDGAGDIGIYVVNGQSANVSSTNFIGNTIAVRHDGTDPGRAFFQSNWWASSGGPHDPSALDGIVNDNPAGQPVTDYVDYRNFLTSPANRAIGPRVVAMEKLAPTTEPIHHRYEATNNALDASGTRNGTPVGDATYGPGRTGGSSFLLDGAGDYFNLGAWAPAGDWTVAAWVNPNSVPATGWVGLAGSQSARRDWSISIYDGNYVAVFEYGQIVDSGIAASIGVWTHVAATLRDGTVHVYIDGVLQNSVAAPDYVPSTSGARLGSTTFNNAGFFDGRIDEVSIVHRSVSDEEVLSLRDFGTLDPFVSQDRFLVTFDRPIDPTSFGVDDIHLSGPSTAVAVDVERVTEYSARVTLSRQLSNAGTYVISVGPDIVGTTGTSMDQDADAVAGESVDDVFQFLLLIDTVGPRVISQSPSGSTGTVLSSIDVTFNEAIDPESLRVENIHLYDPAGVADLDAYDPDAVIDGFSVSVIESTNSFSALSGALAVIADDSRHASTQSVNVPVINYGTSAGNYPSDQTVPLSGSDTNYIVLDAHATITIPTAGKWTFAVASDDGYRLDIDGRIGEFPTGRGIATDLHVFDFPAAGDYPLRMVMFNQTGGLGFELAAAEGEVAVFDASTFQLVGSSGGLSVKTNPVAPSSDIQILSVQSINPSNTTFRISFPPQPSDGEYALVIDPAATDLQGNPQDQDNDGIGGEAVEDRYVGRITVARDPLRVVSQSPTTSINGAFENFTVTFNIPIDPNSFATTDARVIGPGGVVTVTSIDQVDATTYRVNVQRTTEDGDYQLFIGPDITDPAGNRMDGDGDADRASWKTVTSARCKLPAADPMSPAFHRPVRSDRAARPQRSRSANPSG